MSGGAWFLRSAKFNGGSVCGAAILNAGRGKEGPFCFVFGFGDLDFELGGKHVGPGAQTRSPTAAEFKY
jgi:hypothetical protein